MRTAQFAASAVLLVFLLTAQTSALGALGDRRRTQVGAPTARLASSSSKKSVVRSFSSRSSKSSSSSVSSKKIEYAWAGLQLEQRTISLTKVALVTVGSSAEKSGIKANDIVISINGKPVKELHDVYSPLYGPRGSTVTLRYQKGSREYTAVIVRDTDTFLPNKEFAVTEPEAGIFILRIGTLGKTFRETFRAEMQKIANKQPRGVILDLRSTFAGDLPETLLLLGAFLPRATPVIHCAKATMTDRVTNDPPIFSAQMPVIALINGGTVDDAESIANALSITARARLLGETTNGNGYAVLRLETGTVKEKADVLCRFTNAKNEQVQGEGIKPDVTVLTPCQNSSDCVLNEAIALIKKY